MLPWATMQDLRFSSFPDAVSFGACKTSLTGMIISSLRGVSPSMKVLWSFKCLEGTCGFVRAYLITVQLSSIAAFTSLQLWQGGVSELQVIDGVVISFEAHLGLNSPGLISRRMSGVLLVHGYSG